MNILIIYLERDGESAVKLLPALSEKGFIVKTFPILSEEKTGTSSEAQLGAFFSPDNLKDDKSESPFIPLRTIVASTLPGRCYDFIAGYSCASFPPFLVFGAAAVKDIPPEFSPCFTQMKTEMALFKYLDKLKEACQKEELENDTGKARKELLKMGIPINVESMAHCVAEGSISEMALFFAAGFSPNTISDAGIPMLSIAARKGNRETLRFLIYSGADINLISKDRESTALIDSLIGNHPVIAKELIKAGANVNIRNNSGQSAIIIAAGAGDEAVVSALLKAGADPDETDSMGMSARKCASLFHQKNLISLFDEMRPLKAN